MVYSEKVEAGVQFRGEREVPESAVHMYSGRGGHRLQGAKRGEKQKRGANTVRLGLWPEIGPDELHSRGGFAQKT